MKQRIPKAIYNKEFREQAVKQVTDDGLSANEAARRLSLPPSTLANWVKVAKAGKLGEIGSILCQGSAVKYAMIRGLQQDYPVPFMCRIYDVSLSGYYAWLGRPPSKRAQEEARLEVEIRAAHQRTRETYGAEAIQSITEYIEVFYRRQRKQARLGYLSPATFERQFYEKKLAA